MSCFLFFINKQIACYYNKAILACGKSIDLKRFEIFYRALKINVRELEILVSGKQKKIRQGAKIVK